MKVSSQLHRRHRGEVNKHWNMNQNMGGLAGGLGARILQAVCLMLEEHTGLPWVGWAAEDSSGGRIVKWEGWGV